MHNIYVKWDLNIEHLLKTGYVTLIDRGGKRNIHKALDVPGYGMVPCLRKLQNKFTTDPEHLVLVVTDFEDKDQPYTSDIWISRTEVTVIGTISLWG